MMWKYYEYLYKDVFLHKISNILEDSNVNKSYRVDRSFHMIVLTLLIGYNVQIIGYILFNIPSNKTISH